MHANEKGAAIGQEGETPDDGGHRKPGHENGLGGGEFPDDGEALESAAGEQFAIRGKGNTTGGGDGLGGGGAGHLARVFQLSGGGTGETTEGAQFPARGGIDEVNDGIALTDESGGAAIGGEVHEEEGAGGVAEETGLGGFGEIPESGGPAAFAIGEADEGRLAVSGTGEAPFDIEIASAGGGGEGEEGPGGGGLAEERLAAFLDENERAIGAAIDGAKGVGEGAAGGEIAEGIGRWLGGDEDTVFGREGEGADGLPIATELVDLAGRFHVPEGDEADTAGEGEFAIGGEGGGEDGIGSAELGLEAEFGRGLGGALEGYRQ